MHPRPAQIPHSAFIIRCFSAVSFPVRRKACPSRCLGPELAEGIWLPHFINLPPRNSQCSEHLEIQISILFRSSIFDIRVSPHAPFRPIGPTCPTHPTLLYSILSSTLTSLVSPRTCAAGHFDRAQRLEKSVQTTPAPRSTFPFSSPRTPRNK